MPEGTKQAEALAKRIVRSKNTVFFGGAGVSTESGIPDFRSETGLYAAREVYGHSPEELLSRTLFERDPALFFRYYRENLIALHAKPNAAHRALAALEGRGLLKAVITQNIDGLHQAAGSVNVLELHGSNWRPYCVGCGERYTLEDVLNRGFPDGIPTCEKCGNIIRPEVVLYEEGLNEDVLRASVKAIESAALLIVGGTSLSVYPAAGLLKYFRGESLVLINKSATPFDESADLVIRDPIGQALETVIGLL